MKQKAKLDRVIVQEQKNRIRKYDIQSLLGVPKGYEMCNIHITDCDNNDVPWVEFEIYKLCEVE